jgi:hypothetical protein
MYSCHESRRRVLRVGGDCPADNPLRAKIHISADNENPAV